MTSANDPVFPQTMQPMQSHYPFNVPGITKREFFALMILHGIASDGIPGVHHEPQTEIKLAIHQADLLIAELNKEKQL